MLSRLANRVYWLSRYMERVGNNAKILNAYTNLFLDLPVGTELGWHTLVSINGAEKLFKKHYPENNEENIMYFLIFDERNPASVYSTICFARENARTSRDILPSETWEIVNNVYLTCKKEKSTDMSRSNRHLFLNFVINSVMRLEGMLSSGLSRNNTNRFIRLGRNIERADNTTRLLDVGSVLLTEGRSNKLKSHEGVVWMNLLRTMNAYQMYRQSVRRSVKGEDVVRFLIDNKEFPRSVTYCVDQIKLYSSQLSNPEEVNTLIMKLEKTLDHFRPEAITAKGISDNMDEIQKILGEINMSVDSTWFNTDIVV